MFALRTSSIFGTPAKLARTRSSYNSLLFATKNSLYEFTNALLIILYHKYRSAESSVLQSLNDLDQTGIVWHEIQTVVLVLLQNTHYSLIAHRRKYSALFYPKHRGCFYANFYDAIYTIRTGLV